MSGSQIQRVVSVTGSTVNEGQLLRVTLHGSFAYSGTYPLGIQVVDLARAIAEYNDVFTKNSAQFGVAVTTDGQGFARDAVINTIPINDSSNRRCEGSALNHLRSYGTEVLIYNELASETLTKKLQTAVVVFVVLLLAQLALAQATKTSINVYDVIIRNREVAPQAVD